MSTARKARPETPKSSFAALLARGFWPIAIRAKGEPLGKERAAEGKEPIGSGWGLERWSIDRGHKEFSAAPDRGVGICLGPGRGPGGAWLVDVEGDGPGWRESIAALFAGELVETLGWDSTRGGHRLYSVDPSRMEAILPRLKGLEGKGKGAGTYKSDALPGLEVRIGGAKPDGSVKQLQSVVPPTPGTDGTPRQWSGPTTVSPAPEAFYTTLESLAPVPVPVRTDAQPVPAPSRRRTIVDRDFGDDQVAKLVARYCLTCLMDEADKLATTGEGGRRFALLLATMNTAGLVKARGLAEHEYRGALLDAARRCGLPDEESEPLISSALERAEPRDLTKAREWAMAQAAKSRPAPDPATARPELKVVGAPPAMPADVSPPEDDQGEDVPPPGDDDGFFDDGDHRPEIEINTEWHKAVSASILALGDDPDLYCRGGELVKVVREAGDLERVTARTAFRDVAGTPKVMPLSESNVGVRLTTVAKFFKWKPDKHGELEDVPCGPPPWLIKSISTHGHWPGVRPLLAVAECPFPRPDGSIVEAPGFDPETATLLLPSMDFPPVPSHPTRDDARAAWARIASYVEDFPFASEDDLVVYLAGMLTVIARPAILGPVPGIAVIANKAAVGKGMLINTMTIPGTGRSCPTSAYPEEKDEAVKVKVAIAKASKSVVHFDNLDEGDSYGSGPLDSALTSTIVDDRQLGSNDSPPLPLRTCWFLSGNNVTPAKDAYRRWLPLYLRTTLERPEERTDYKRPRLLADMQADRAEIIRDCLTILRAHSIVGRPQKPGWPGFGSFEDWSDIVRGAVWFATGRDCLATQRSTSATSPERLAKLALLEGLSELEGIRWPIGDGVTTSEALKQVEDNPGLYDTLRTVLKERGRGGKMPSAGSIGKTLAGIKDSLIEGFRLRDVGLKHGAVLWAVELVKEEDEGGVWELRENVLPPPTRDSISHTDVMAHSEERKRVKERLGTNSLTSQPPLPISGTDEWPEGRE